MTYFTSTPRRTVRRGEASLLKEIRHHLAKGRDVATIVTWTETPYSVIQRLVDQIKAETGKPLTPTP